MFEVDEQGRIFDYRAPRDELLYQSPERFVGRRVTEVIPSDAADVIMEAIGEATRTGKSSGSIYSLEMPGGVYWFELSLSTKGGRDKEDGHLIAIVRDVTDRKLYEQALAESETLFRTLVEASPDAVTVTDLEGTIISASQQSADLQGYDSPEDLIGRNAFELFPAEELERAAENMRKTLQEGRLTGLEYKLLKTDGSTIIGEMNTALIKDSANKPKAFLATVRDITKRKQHEAKLKALNDALDAFARTVSHDLKGPLASIVMSNELLDALLAGPLTEEAR